MRFGPKRKKSSQSPRTGLQMERLEDRAMMAVIPLGGGQVASFHDADGTQVKVKLVGPGQGAIELVGGVLTGAAIDNLVLSGTTGESKLTISTRGGSISGTTINELVLSKALNEAGALKSFKATSVDFVGGGQLSADGDIGDLCFRSLGEGAAINVTGSVGRLKTNALHANAAVDVSATLAKFVARSVAAGSNVSAGQLDELKIAQQVSGAAFQIGDGGLAKATLKNIHNSSIASDGHIGDVVVKGDALGAAFSSNIDAGSDGAFGTIDDFVTNLSAAGYINRIKFKGLVGASHSAQEVNVVASGTVGQVKLTRWAQKANTVPLVWTEATQQSIPLSILQASANATGVADDQIWIAVFGQEVVTPLSGQPPVTTAFDTYYLDPTQLNGSAPKLTTTKGLTASTSTPNNPIVPSFTIQQWKNASQAWGSNLAFPSPSLNSQWSGRIVISVGAPVQAQVNTTDGTVSSPSASDLTDPSTGTFYDFLEFTVTNPNKSGAAQPLSLDIDTTQVDSFGLPIQLQLFQPAASGQNYQFEFTGSTTAGQATVTGIADMTGLAKGQPVFGVGIPGGATIASVNGGAGSITLNVNATHTSASAALRAYTAPQFVTDFTGTTTSGSATITNIPDTTGLGTSQPVFGAGIPAGSTIQSIVNSKQSPQGNTPGSITLTIPATASGASVSLRAFSGGPVGVQALRGDIMSGSTNDALLEFLTNQVGSQHYRAQAFLPTAAAYQKSPPTAITGVTGAGVPITISTANVANVAVGDVVVIGGVHGNTAANGMFKVSSVDKIAKNFTLDGPAGNGDYTSGGTWTAYTSSGRLVSPKDVVEEITDAQNTSALNNYYNKVIDALFLQYLPSDQSAGGDQGGGQILQLVSTAFNSTNITYHGKVTNTGTVNQNYAIQFTDPTKTDPNTYNVYYPWFAAVTTPSGTMPSNAPDANVYVPKFGLAVPPQWMIEHEWNLQSASQMIFACDAVFADDNARKAFDMDPTKAPGGAAVLGDLENSISAAFNRGIVLNPADTWGDTTTWFQQNPAQASAAGIEPGNYNYWVEYWHQSGLMLSDLAYAFPYDDKFGASTNLNLSGIGLAQITLGNWSSSAAATTTTFQNFPASAEPGERVSLTAHVAGNSPSGSVAFYINGIPLNSSIGGPSPPIEAVPVVNNVASLDADLPSLPDGSQPHTYTVTAVYSGDTNNLPSVVSSPLLVEEHMQLQFTPGSAPVGGSTTITAILPGTSFTGKIQFKISRSDGSGVQDLSGLINVTNNSPHAPVTIPANLLTFTGDVTTGSATIENVSNFLDLATGQTLSSPNLHSQTTISSFQTASLILSKPATASGTVMLTSGGRTFRGITSVNSNQVNGILSLTGLSDLDLVTGPGIPNGTTIQSRIQGSIALSHTAIGTQAGATLTSNAVGSYPITAVYTPNPGSPVATTSPFSVTA